MLTLKASSIKHVTTKQNNYKDLGESVESKTKKEEEQFDSL